MQRYPVRASHRPNLRPEALEATVRAEFGEATREGDAVLGRFGAISRLKVEGAGRELVVDLVMDPKVSEETARETIGRYNRFLEEVTGFSSKERARRLRKSASD